MGMKPKIYNMVSNSILNNVELDKVVELNVVRCSTTNSNKHNIVFNGGIVETNTNKIIKYDLNTIKSINLSYGGLIKPYLKIEDIKSIELIKEGLKINGNIELLNTMLETKEDLIEFIFKDGDSICVSCWFGCLYNVSKHNQKVLMNKPQKQTIDTNKQAVIDKDKIALLDDETKKLLGLI